MVLEHSITQLSFKLFKILKNKNPKLYPKILLPDYIEQNNIFFVVRMQFRISPNPLKIIQQRGIRNTFNT